MSDKYQNFGAQVGSLVDLKQEAYGDSFNKCGKIMEILYPNGIPVSGLVDALGVARTVDKLFRIATRKDAFGESPWKDIAGYGLLGAQRDSEQSDSQPVEVPQKSQSLEQAEVSCKTPSENLWERFKVRIESVFGSAFDLVTDKTCPHWMQIVDHETGILVARSCDGNIWDITPFVMSCLGLKPSDVPHQGFDSEDMIDILNDYLCLAGQKESSDFEDSYDED